MSYINRKLKTKKLALRACLTLLIYLITTHCNHPLEERLYMSDKSVTGGFINIILDLESNGDLFLTFETFSSEKCNLPGTSFVSQNITIKGNWDEINGILSFTFEKAKTSIDSLFLNTDYADLVENSILRFTPDSDTAFVFGIPCILHPDKKN